MTYHQLNDFMATIADEVYTQPLIDPKAKALIAIAVEVVPGTHQGRSDSLVTSIDNALQIGVTKEEIEELWLLLGVYRGFNQVPGGFGTLNQIVNGNKHMISAIKPEDYAQRDRLGKIAFYVLLWKRKSINHELFYNYWKNVHGPLCAHLPGQHQYWQFHLAPHQSGIWPMVQNVENTCPEADCFDGIAELTFASEADFQAYIQAFGILMADEHNLFSKAIAYNTKGGNSKTYIDRIPTGAPNGELDLIKFHVMVQKSDAVTEEAFRQYVTDTFASAIVQSDLVLKFRLHLLEAVDNSRPSDDGVCRYEPLDKQYQAAFEIAFADSLAMEKFLASTEYKTATQKLAKYVKGLFPFPERSTYTFVYDGEMTLAGKRSSQVADLILQAGATNQLQDDVVRLMNNIELQPQSSSNSTGGLGHYLQGVQHIGITVDNMAQAVEFYTEVLGGKLVVSEEELVGDKAQNTLFQTEELQAIAAGIEPEQAAIPHLRSGKDQALDVKFISFGNVVVELLQIREAGKPSPDRGAVSSLPSHIGHVNAMHLSFNVKEGIDLNQFAQMLEDECQSRGMTSVVFNRVIQVKSEAERRAIAGKYNSFKFWSELEDDEPIDWSKDPMEGWSLFYCKGPNGEQLEFNQPTRGVKEKFRQGVQEYNQANDTAFIFTEHQITSATATASNNQPLLNSIKNSSMLEPLPGQNADLVKRLFSRGEAFDSSGFVTFFTDNPVYQFGNFEVCLDKEAIKKSADNFFSQIDAVYHEIKMMQEVGDVVFVEMDVYYWRKDGSMIALPCCDIFRVAGDKFSELRIFMDVNPVFDPSIPVPTSASVFTASRGQTLMPPGVMKRHFAEHPEGKQRVADGYGPKWAVAGPKWAIAPDNPAATEQFNAVGELSQAIIAQDWAKVKTYLTDDIFYKVGSTEPRYGKQEVVDFFAQTFKTTAIFTGHKVRKVWQEPDIISVEMDAYYQLIPTGKQVTISCCDIYRMRGNKVSEWRVYADMSPWQEAIKSTNGAVPKQTVEIA